MKYKIEETYLTKYSVERHEDCVNHYFQQYRQYIDSLPLSQQRQECISAMNYIRRRDLMGAEDVHIKVKEGDICYLDFGKAYRLECAYQHLGLVLTILCGKIFVIPMTSNKTTVEKSLTKRKKHLYYIGQLPGMRKPSCLFLNDAKFLNPARIISKVSYLSVNSQLFRELKEYYSQLFLK